MHQLRLNIAQTLQSHSGLGIMADYLVTFGKTLVTVTAASPFSSFSASWHFLTSVLCLFVFAGDSRLLEVSLSGFKIPLPCLFYDSLSQFNPFSASLFHLGKPRPRNQARYHYIWIFNPLQIETGYNLFSPILWETCLHEHTVETLLHGDKI